MAAPPRPLTSRVNPLLVRLRKLAAEPSAYRKHGILLPLARVDKFLVAVKNLQINHPNRRPCVTARCV